MFGKANAQSDIIQRFAKFSRTIEHSVGSPWAFIAAISLIIGWVIAGPFFDWSDSHALFINTATTILSFVILILIQSTQTRDTTAINAKLDELIRVTTQAHNELIGSENLSESELKRQREIIQRDLPTRDGRQL